MKKQFLYIFMLALLAMLVGFSVFSFLNKNETKTANLAMDKKLKIIQNKAIQLQEPKEKVVEISVQDIFEVEEIPQFKEENLAKKERELEMQNRILDQLQTRMDFIYRQSKKINTPKGILQSFQKMKYEDVFLCDMKENTLYGTNDIEDINARSIKLEQIQKVAKHKEGFIVSDVEKKGTKRYIYVKSLGLKDLYIGVDFYVNSM